jgi:peptidoglycan hydrolase-like protein with peptidoglycan-binding domain
MSVKKIAAVGLMGLLVAAPVADARPKGIHKGMHGPAVKRLQKNLTRAGFSTGADGAFGPATKASLMSWERWKHRRVDGIATRRDRRALRRSARFGTRTLKVGMRGRDVRGLQYWLARRGYAPGRDGAFGPITRSKLIAWESAHGRRADGVATRADMRALRSGSGGAGHTPAPRPFRGAWISPRGFAHAPGAPARVVRMIRAGNRIAKTPYKYGGGHGSWNDSGYDCSGSVSYVLHAGGLLSASRPSGGFVRWGFAGYGKWVTVFAHGGHMWMKIAGLRFDTTDRERDGTRWHRDIRSSAGYAIRHPGGIG